MLTGATFRIYNDHATWHLDGYDGETLYLADGTDTEKIKHIANNLPGKTWHGYRGSITIEMHGAGAGAVITRGMILGRWQPQPNSTITTIKAPQQTLATDTEADA